MCREVERARRSWGRETCSWWIAIRAQLWWNQIDMITIHIVLQYYDVIARDLPLIGVIVGKLVDYKRVGGSAEPTRSLEQGQNSTDSRLIAGLTTILGQF